MTKLISTRELVELHHEHGSSDAVAKALELRGIHISGRSIRRRLQDVRQSSVLSTPTTETMPIAGGSVLSPHKLRKRLTGKRFVFTSAQNNTFVHNGFLQALKYFCETNKAELLVSRFAYNKSGFQNSSKDQDDGLWYDTVLIPYFFDESAQVADDLVFCGELDILPTATDPLSGFENYCANNSAIIPHTKLAMKSMPRMKGEDPRFLYTTGAITQRNYIQKKAGQKAEFHHVFAALYVEIDDEGDWFARQLVADTDGIFQDLTTLYTPQGVITGMSVEAINWGDIHAEMIDVPALMGAFDGPESMLSVLQPAYQFIHDLTDFRARNHHNINDPYFMAEQYFNGTYIVQDAIAQSAAFLSSISDTGVRTVVVESNHDLAFKRWLKEANVKMDPANAEYWHHNNAACYKAIREKNKDFSVFEYAIRKIHRLPMVEFLREDDSFVVCNDAELEHTSGKVVGGVECGMHGHHGPNGARGSGANLRHIGRKANIGHVHSAGIIDGVYMAGVLCELDLGYNKGPSSWSHSHIVTYPNGKRTIITMRNIKWRA